MTIYTYIYIYTYLALLRVLAAARRGGEDLAPSLALPLLRPALDMYIYIYIYIYSYTGMKRGLGDLVYILAMTGWLGADLQGGPREADSTGRSVRYVT